MAEEAEKIKYDFKTEEDRQLAIGELPEDAPVGIDVRQWQNEQAAVLDEIMNTALAVEGEVNPEGTASLPPAEAETVAPASTEPTEIEKLTAHFKVQEKQMEANYATKFANVSSDFEKKIEELKTNQAPAPAAAEEATDFKNKVEEHSNRITELQREMQSIKDDDSIFDNNDYINKSTEVNQLNMEINNLRNQEVSKLNNTVNEMKASAIAESEKRNADALASEQQKQISAEQNAANMKMETFRNKHAELKGEKSYSDMEEEFMTFGQQTAAAYFGKLPNEVNTQEIEVAMVKFKEKTPALLEKLSASGVKAPETYPQYDKLFNVKMALQGRKLNSESGVWENMVNELGQKVNLASFDDAYNYINRVNGTIEQQTLDAQQSAVKEFADASQRRAPVTELSSEHQRQDVDDLTKEQANQIVMGADDEELVVLKRQNPSHPKIVTYEKAAALLGFEPIPV